MISSFDLGRTVKDVRALRSLLTWMQAAKQIFWDAYNVWREAERITLVLPPPPPVALATCKLIDLTTSDNGNKAAAEAADQNDEAADEGNNEGMQDNTPQDIEQDDAAQGHPTLSRLSLVQSSLPASSPGFDSSVIDQTGQLKGDSLKRLPNSRSSLNHQRIVCALGQPRGHQQQASSVKQQERGPGQEQRRAQGQGRVQGDTQRQTQVEEKGQGVEQWLNAEGHVPTGWPPLRRRARPMRRRVSWRRMSWRRTRRWMSWNMTLPRQRLASHLATGSRLTATTTTCAWLA